MSAAPATTPGTPGLNDPKKLDDFYVPAYRILIHGKEQPHLEQHILSVTYNDSLTNVDSVDLVVNNWDPGEPVDNQAVEGKFRFSEGQTFDPWKDIDVSMGYYRKGQDQLQRMILGEIVTVAPDFPASGPSTLRVKALNILHQFRFKQKTEQFTNRTDTEIAQKIVEDINKELKAKLSRVTLRMDPKEVEKNVAKEKLHKKPFLEMHNQYPIVFLMQRSRDIGYDISVEDEITNPDNPKKAARLITLHYRSSDDVLRPTYNLKWGKSLISFQPTLQTANQVNAVTVRGWNFQTKKPIEETVTRAQLVKKGEKIIALEDLAVSEASLAQKLEIVVDRGFKDAKTAHEVATSALLRIAQGLVEAKGKTIGLPDLRAGNKVNVEMAATSRFNGTYLVTSTTHTIGDGGYTTDFSARMEAKLKPV